MAQPEATKKLLNHYLRRLTNLSGNNRSLFLPRFSSDQFIDLHLVSQLNKEKSFSIIEALIAEKKKIICPVTDARLEASNEVSKKLKKLQRTSEFIFEERGSKDLHLGWPFIRGKLMDGTSVRCPLIFFPVELGQENNHWVIRPRENADISFNKAFLLAYSFYNQVKVDEALMEENFEDVDRDSTVFRTAIYQFLQKGLLDIHFNPDNYRDEITPFIHYTKEEFEGIYKNGELKLYPEAVLGIFPQAGSYLVPDYLDLIENEKITDLEDFFTARNASPPATSFNFIPHVKEEKVYAAFPMDVWQENALKAVKLGNSVVVQGPPGTGKSQLICNLISDAISNGKRVIVVCQKRAALDVVYARLKEKKLSSFLGLVHDFKNDRKVIYEKIASQIDLVDEYKAKNNSLDAIQLERIFYQASRRIDQITDELEEFKKALFDKSESGTSVKELYLRSDPGSTSVNLKQEYQHFRFDAVPELLNKLKSHSFYAGQFEQQTYPWRERKSFSGFQLSDRAGILSHLKEIPLYFEMILQRLHELSGANLTWEECDVLQHRKVEAEELLELVGTKERFTMLQSMMNESEEETSALWLSNIERVMADCFQAEGPEITVPLHQLGQLQQALRKGMKTRRSLIGLIRWELFSKDKIFITRVLVANELKSNKAGFISLEKKLDNRLNLEHNFSKLRSKKWLINMPDGYHLTTLQHWTQNQQRAIKAKGLFHTIRGLKNIVDPPRMNWEEFRIRLQSLFKLFEDIPLKKAIWLNYFTPGQLALLTEQNNEAAGLAKALKNDFDALVEFDRQKESLTSDEKNIIQKLFLAAGSWDHPELERLLLNSLCLAWIEHMETKFPSLNMVSSGKLTLLEGELREKILEKQKISNEILLLRARERVTDNLEFNRLNNLVTYRDLYHQVTKKKRVWPLRKLVCEFEEELFRVVPCWLVSPESVSAIFPMKEMFDLVIFDEASQCFAERGIPAMYRAKQVAVAGDDQQLRPNDLYQVRWQEDDTDHPDLEVDSLLELCARYLTSVDLRSHYRSQSLPLIDFSNQHFYQGRLQLLPSREAVNKTAPPIEYIKLDGIWTDHTNQIEAETIADLVAGLIRDCPKQTVGVVTFNSPQQNLILDLLEEKAMTQGLVLPDTFFVKNIENVQGDEKDIIIFSIAYAPDKKGKLTVQFGSLNQQGGENRLNVAITRAREKIIVVTSIWPEALHVEDSVNRGPRLLKDYLHYARAVSQNLFVPFIVPEINASIWYLKRKIKAGVKGKFPSADILENHFPFVDLVVTNGEHYAGIILTDDENYFKSLSAKERHAFLPELLEQKNWKYLSQFSRNYWLDMDKAVNEVGKFVTR